MIIRATQLAMCGNLLLLFKQLLGIASLLLLFRPSMLVDLQVAYAECEIQNRTRAASCVLLSFSSVCQTLSCLPQSSPAVSTSSGDSSLERPKYDDDDDSQQLGWERFFFIQRSSDSLHLKFLRHIYERKRYTFFVLGRPFFNNDAFQFAYCSCCCFCLSYSFSRSYPYIEIEPGDRSMSNPRSNVSVVATV